ncbi:hypothetical protein OH77DRAFT_1399047 [Trametes cingulata]|nr:hypothetical protein OH77DRAFT_1399047 [Trametes cingulata]
MTDSAACRILVISPSATRALEFVERVQALSDSRTTSRPQAISSPTNAVGSAGTSVSPAAGTSKDPLSAGNGSTTVPWTIVNKYYTADIHFQTHEFDDFRVHHAIGVPAVIYVWGPGEPYKDHIPEIAHKIQHYDPEVSLAVRFGGSATAVAPSAEDDGLDEFLSTHGFEFVEGDRTFRRPTQDEDRHSDDEDTGIPGLPRVIDALSTIMWPSLVQSQATRQRKSRARELLGWALEEEADDGLRALIADPASAAATTSSSDATTAASVAVTNARKSRMQREMEELERWLEDEEAGSGLQHGKDQTDGKPAEPAEEEDAEAQAWVNSAPVTSVEGWEDMLTPPAIRTPRPDDGPHPAAFGGEHGFEDDFADFVSATSDTHLQTPSHVFGHGFGLGHGEERLLEVNYDIGRLTPMHTGASYRSLASVSDFGGDEGVHGGGYGALGDAEDDPDLPSRAEILETSRRLFGAAAFAPAPDAALSTAPPSSSSAEEQDSSGSTSTASNPMSPQRQARTSAPAPDADSSADLSLDSEDADEHSFAPFDLSRVFSALQGMKAEIAGMEDEDERRRAAARVALGLVYGLGVSADDHEPDASRSSDPHTHA